MKNQMQTKEDHGRRSYNTPVMRVTKRDGTMEPVDVTKIVERVTQCCQGLTQVDPLRVATKAISGLYDGASTKEWIFCERTSSSIYVPSNRDASFEYSGSSLVKSEAV